MVVLGEGAVAAAVAVEVVFETAVFWGGAAALLGETGRLGPFRGVHSVEIRGRRGNGVTGRWPVVDGLSRS